jgi:hypothetical protein
MNNSFILTDNEVKLELNRNKINIHQNLTQNIQNQESRYGTTVDLNSNKITDQLDKHTTRNKLITNDIKYRISRINVDSRYRDKDPINIIDRYINTASKIVFTEKSNIIKILMPLNHGLIVDNFITIANIEPISIIQSANTLTLIKNSKYIYINHTNHQFVGTNNIIRISGVENTDNTDYFIENLPLSIVNTEHKIILIMVNGVIDPDNYLIDTGIYIDNDYLYNDNNYTIEILTYNGIHIKYINASFPISNDIQQGYHIITESSIDYIKIKLTVSTELIYNTIISINDNVLIGKVSKSITGYPNPEFYKIKFKSYYNIKKIKLVSTEIPNTELLIKSNTSFQNNKLYWQILQDGDYIYEISILSGNYDATSLQLELFNKISNIKRKFGSYLNSILYDEYCIPIININPFNNLFSMQIMSNIVLSTNIVIYNAIYTDNFIRINITHPYHNLNIGDKITISNAVNVFHSDSVLYIPLSIINTQHTVETIIDNNNYIVKLAKYNPVSNGGLDQITINNGGNAVNILFPLTFRLLFNYTDTIGKILGYNNLGNINSITIFNKLITNNTLYINSSNINSIGLKNLDVAILNFQTYPYILMVSNVFNSIINYKESNGVFAKIFLTGNPGSIIYDQYVQITEDVPITNSFINEIEFKFLTPDGNLYNFNGYEHSYTLEIYELLD